MFKSIGEAFEEAVESETAALARRLAGESTVDRAPLTDDERAILDAFDLPEPPKEEA